MENGNEDERKTLSELKHESSPRGASDHQDKDGKDVDSKSASADSPKNTVDLQEKDEKNVSHNSSSESSPGDMDEKDVVCKSVSEDSSSGNLDLQENDEKDVLNGPRPEISPRNSGNAQNNDEGVLTAKVNSLDVNQDELRHSHESEEEHASQPRGGTRGTGSQSLNEASQALEEVLDEEKEADPVFDGTEGPEPDGTKSSTDQSLDQDSGAPAAAWPEKAVALKNYVKVKGAVAVSTVLRRLSGKKDDLDGEEKKNNDLEEKKNDEEEDPRTEPKSKEGSQQTGEWSTWNPLSYIKVGRDTNIQSNPEQTEDARAENSVGDPIIKGRILVFTRLGCQECRELRVFMKQKRLKYVEINIDIYPSRKVELEKNTGSSAVPVIYFNDFLVRGLSELKAMDDSGKLDEKVNDVINDEPSPAAPLPPLSGDDDVSGSGKIDELASIVTKMKESIVLKDRFYKMRRFKNCFLGSEAADFLSEDQYLEREEAVEFGRKLASKHFFRHVLDENVFEDGNHLYRFLEHDPVVMSQCYNIPRGTIDVQPKPIVEIASGLRFLSFAIFEAYVSEDGRHVDYRSICASEEFQRYLRIIEELQRVELDGISREEKLAFFINLYNMMAIHAVLTWGYPVGPLDRRKFLGDFKYVVGGCTYSLSAIQNGILRANQRPPYNLMKPFGPKDKRFRVALQYPEPLVHFALVCGTRSGPALRCYSPGNIDEELMEAAHVFIRNGGLVIDSEAKVASVSKILKWYSVDFGKNETEVLKHAANYLEPTKSEELLELLASTQLKVIYQPYDWSLNC